MADAAAALPQLASCLRGGGIAVLFVPITDDVGAARDAVRAVCTDVLTALAARYRLLPHASRSATPGLGGLALSLSAGIGVDVERLRPELVDDDLLALGLHPGEQLLHDAAASTSQDRDAAARLFFAAWTRKEAVMKALGLGLALAPASFTAGPPTLDWQPVRTPHGACRVRSVAAGRGTGCGGAAFAAALAVAAGRSAPAVVRTFWLGGEGEPLGASVDPPSVGRQQRVWPARTAPA